MSDKFQLSDIDGMIERIADSDGPEPRFDARIEPWRVPGAGARRRSRGSGAPTARRAADAEADHICWQAGWTWCRKVDDLASYEKTGMSLNIKDPEAHRLAQAIARATGETMTRVVTDALRERFARIERRRARASVEELLAIAERAATHVKRPYLDHAELLYDERGLPK